MKVCPECGETYNPFIEFCFADGAVLTMEAIKPVSREAEAFDAPPPPKMLQGSGNASYTRSATPVPRARRPGRSLVRNDGGGVYTPPEAPMSVPTPDSIEEPIEAVDDSDGWEDPAWEDQAIEAFEEASSTPTPPPAPMPVPLVERPSAPVVQSAPPAAMAVEAPPSGNIVDEDEEEEEGGGLFVMFGVGAVAVALILGVTGYLAYTLLGTEPDGPDVVSTQPVPRLPTPTIPVPSPVPEPEVEPTVAPTTEPSSPEPVGPVPEVVEQPEPAEVPDPVAPEPVVEPAPAAQPSPEPVAAAVVPTPEPPAVKPKPPAATGTVIVNSAPTGARITLDGELVATTPFAIADVGAGRHTMRLTKEGYRPFDHVFTVPDAGGRVQLPSMALEALEGTVVAPTPEPEPEPAPPAEENRSIVVVTNVSQVKGTVNGQAFSTPQTLHNFAPGRALFTATLDGQVQTFVCRIPTLAEHKGTWVVKLDDPQRCSSQ